VHIGKKIRRFRLQKGLSQEELVQDIASTSYLSRIENSKVRPSKAFITAVCERLNISPDALYSQSSSEDYIEEINEAVSDYKRTKQLSSKQRALLEFQSMEPHEPGVLVRIYGILLRFYIENGEIGEADKLYSRISTTIPPIKDKSFSKDLFYFHISCGNYCYAKQAFYEADHHYAQAERFSPYDTPLEIAHLMYNISIVKQRTMSNQELALYYSRKACEIYSMLHDHYQVARTLITMGVQCHLSNQFNQSLEYLERSESIFIEMKDWHMLGMVEYNKGRVYQRQGLNMQAIPHFQKSLEYYDKAGEAKGLRDRLYSYRSLIEIYMNTKHVSAAEQTLQEAFQILKHTNHSYLLRELEALQARILLLKKLDAEYERELRKIIQSCVDEKHYELVKTLCAELGDYLFATGSYKKASQYYRKYVDMDKYRYAKPT
jgi:tetratricopeptide (TPR) repeat protein